MSLAGADLARAQAVLDDTSALIRVVVGDVAAGWVTDDDPPALNGDVPDIVVTVCLAVAERAFRNPDGVRSESLGSYAVTYSGSNLAGVFLTANEKALLRAAGGTSSVTSVAMESAFPGPITDKYVPTEPLPDADLMPWVTLGDEGAY